MSVENYVELSVRINLENFEFVKDQCAVIIRENKFLVQETRYRVDRVNQEVQLTYTLTYRKVKSQDDLRLSISRLEGIREVSG